MGYSPGLLDTIVEWSKRFDIRPGARVLDIGTQELFCADDPASLNWFVGHFGGEPYAAEELKRIKWSRPFATQDAWINILLRRARGGAFCVPVDCMSDHKQIA
jgi:hypothetical protein